MLPAIAGALIGAGSNIVDSVAQGFTNRANRNWSEKMYAVQRRDSLADFNMQNEYNSPGKQMQRLKDAGLNPNLVYGNGAAATSTAAIKPASVPQGTARYQPLQLGDSIAQYINLKNADANIDLKKTQEIVNLITAVMHGKQTEKIEADTASTKFDTALKTDLRSTSMAAAAASLNKTLADTDFTIDANARANALQSPNLARAILEVAGQEIKNAKDQAEISEIRARVNNILSDTRIKNLDADLKARGIQPHDSAIMRGIQEMLQIQPNVPGPLFKSPVDILLDKFKNKIPKN